MRVLIVCSRREYCPHTDYMAPFVYEQMKAIQGLGVECRVVLVDNGAKGYLQAAKRIRKAVREFSPDIVHAHYGLCGVIANRQRRVPVVTTFHGTDLNDKHLRFVSQIAIHLSRRSIVVSQGLKDFLPDLSKIKVIPCGIDANLLIPLDRKEAREKLGWENDAKYVLFSKEFSNKAKNYPLAKASVDEYNYRFAGEKHAELLEFIGYSREQVLLLYNAVDCVLMTSDHEGSPQFIKEAMACNCPIVSVDVGDVKQVITGTDGCFLAKRIPEDIAEKLDKAIRYGKTNGREKVLQEYDSKVIARKVIDVYEEIIDNE